MRIEHLIEYNELFQINCIKGSHIILKNLNDFYLKEKDFQYILSNKEIIIPFTFYI